MCVCVCVCVCARTHMHFNSLHVLFCFVLFLKKANVFFSTSIVLEKSSKLLDIQAKASTPD